MIHSLFWLEPQSCDPPHAVTHPDKCDTLARNFTLYGWGAGFPVLVGYPMDGRIQLLSGSHRWAAAKRAGIQIPVMVQTRAAVEMAYGDLEAWQTIMQSGEL